VSHISNQSAISQVKEPYQEKSTTEKHLEKASMMLEEQKREEKSGYQFPGYGS